MKIMLSIISAVFALNTVYGFETLQGPPPNKEVLRRVKGDIVKCCVSSS